MRDGVALPLEDHVHSLGVLLDPALLLDKQVAAVVRNMFHQLSLMCSLRLLRILHRHLQLETPRCTHAMPQRAVQGGSGRGNSQAGMGRGLEIFIQSTTYPYLGALCKHTSHTPLNLALYTQCRHS